MATDAMDCASVCILMTTVDAFSVPRFLLVTSRRQPNRWIFPKGGIEDGEEPTEAAEREAWEEGIRRLSPILRFGC
jgi:8-oxo-dGTP pyrophosphatase MutT (NUDIX family)